MKSGYSFQTKENMAKACARNINISPKHAIEISRHIRGKSLSTAKRILRESISETKAIPLKRFTNGPGHKSGMSSGRFMVKACKEILVALESAESNAVNKGLNVSDLKLTHVAAQRAGKQWHYGRKKRSLFKSSHIEVVVEEVKGLSDEKKKERKNIAEKKSQKGKK